MATTQRVVFLTCSDTPSINAEYCTHDDLAAETLRQHGLSVVASVWDDDNSPLCSSDLIIIRSVWDYYLKIPTFLSWLDKMEECQTPLLNSTPIVRWNMHKSYLLELSEKGIHIANTEVYRKGSQPPDLCDVLKRTCWEQMIVKPCIGGGSYGVTRLNNHDDAYQFQSVFDSLLKEKDMILQRYIKGITSCGEWSLMFFNKKFSHCVVKVPPVGDYRTLPELFGPIQAIKPTKEMINFATNVLDQVDAKLLQARVDIMKDEDGQMYLGELELIEPALFLDFDDDAPKKFADAIQSFF